MPIDLSALDGTTRLLFTVPLQPLQGDRFQPTGFPSLGAATYQSPAGSKLLVESTQSMANRMEATCWDCDKNEPITALKGISHVRVTRNGKFLTDTMLEAHRLNSPYLMSSSDRTFLDCFLNDLRQALGGHVIDENQGTINRQRLAETLLKYDIGSLVHGCFLSANSVKLRADDKKGDSIAGGRLRVARALSAFIEASGVQIAASGGVKNDHVNPSGVTEEGFGNVPFARDEYTAERIDCRVNIDLAQIRGYGLGPDVERLLVLLALHRVRKLLDGDLRLRTACDLEPVDRSSIRASRPDAFLLPPLFELEAAVRTAIDRCASRMTCVEAKFEEELRKGKEEKEETGDPEEEKDASGD